MTDSRKGGSGQGAHSDFMAGLLDSTSLVVYLKDIEGRYIYVNRRYEALAGVPRAALLGKRDPDFFPAEVAGIFKAQDAQVIACRHATEFEETIPLPGGVHSFVTEKFPLLNEKGEVWAVGGFCTEITAQKTQADQLLERERLQAFSALRVSEERFASLFEQAPLGYQSLDENGNFLEVNSTWCDTLGYTKPEVIGKWFGDFLAPEYVAAFRERFPVFKAQGRIHSEFLMLHKDGRRRHIAFDGRIGYKPDGNFKQTHCILQDITERKQDEAVLQAIIDNNLMSIQIVDKDGFTLKTNPAYKALFGSVPPANFSIFAELCHRVLGFKKLLARVKNGEAVSLPDTYFNAHDVISDMPDVPVWVHAVIFPLGNADRKPEKFVLMHEDISKRKQAEEELKASQSMLRETEQIGRVGGWSFNIDTLKQTWTEEVYRIHEVDITPNPSVEKGINYYTPESRPIIERAVKRAIEHGEGFDLKLEIITAKGNHRAVHTIGNADLKNRRIYGFFQDITERKQQELYLEISQEVLKILNESQGLKDAVGKIVAVLKTRGGFDAVGMRLKEREDFPYFCQDGFPDDFLLTENTLVERTADGGLCRDKNGKVCLECTCGLVISGKPSPVLTKGGSFWTNYSYPLLDLPADQDPRLHPRNNCIHKKYASIALVPIRGKAGIVGLLQLNSHKKDCFTEGIIAQLENMVASIGEALMRKRAEAEREAMHSEFLQSQKMESIGRLAGGVAHDFNNLLTAIGGYAGFLFKGLAADDPKREDAKEILNATERAGMLTKQLLAFSRKQILAPQLIDLNATLAGTVNMLRRLIGEDMKLEVKLAKQPCVVNVDAGQIGQVLLNLTVNSRDAMPEGGRIVIETSIVNPEATFFSKHPNLKPGPLVCLSLSDTGYGISPENKEHLFEPFFTTKEKGKGTGLGLSTVFGVIKQSGGDIEVESSAGHGTTFRIYLPQMTDAAIHKDNDKDKDKDKDKDSQLGRAEVILLVEDEESLRHLGERLLRAGGYTVISAADGLEAIAAAERYGKPVDLLLTDVVMPGMNGRELAKRLVDAKLAARTLYMSGYTDDAIIKHGVLEPGIAFIYKPFTSEALSAKLREVLDGPADQSRA